MAAIGPRFSLIDSSGTKEEEVLIRLIPEPTDPSVVVGNLASIRGPVDIYFWYEGREELPTAGAQFMTNFLFAPIYAQNKEARLCLCSFRNWDFTKSVANMPIFTPLGEAVQRIHSRAIDCVDSSAFFKYCQSFTKDSPLYRYMGQELLSKQRGVVTTRQSDMKIKDLFDQRLSLLDVLKERDAGFAYPYLRYVEGYYLIQESVKRGIEERLDRVEIAFVLPNDECKFYRDFPADIGRMLRLDFGRAIEGLEIRILFQFFRYGASIGARPFKAEHPDADRVEPEEIPSYFRFLQSIPSFSSIPRDDAHSLNDGLAETKDSPDRREE